MKNNLKLLITALIVIIAFTYTKAQEIDWAINWNSSSTNNDQGYAVTTDASGNVYVTGEAKKGVGTDSYIETIKYNYAGSQQWAVSYNTTNGGRDYAMAIAVDGSGNVWVAGTYYTGTTYYQDLILLKYNSSGTLQGGYPKVNNDLSGTGETPKATCIAIYGSNVFVGGMTATNLGQKLIVLKDNSGGAGWSWTYTYPTSSYVKTAIATDLKTNYYNNTLSLYVTGYYEDEDNYESINTVTAKIDPSDGTEDWATTYNNSTEDLFDMSNALAVNTKNDYLYIAGYSTSSSYGKEAMVIKYSTLGVQQGVAKYNGGNSYHDTWTDIALYNSDNIALVGGTKGVSSTANDFMTAAYSTSTGSLSGTWSTNPRTYDGSGTDIAGTDFGYALDLEPTTGLVYITGKSYETSGGVNITTIGYDAADGSVDWGPEPYDYGSDLLFGGVDEMSYKNAMITRYNDTYCIDEVLITGESAVYHHGYDYITIKYGPVDIEPCAKKIPNPDYEPINGFYPNPFSTEAIISFSADFQLNNTILYIYDVLGNMVRSQNVTSNNILIKRENLNSGIYFYKLSNNAQILSSGRFVIAD